MKSHFTGLAFAALLVAASALPGYAEDAAAPTAAPAAPAAATQTEAPPASVPRPPLAAEPTPNQRRYAHRHWRRSGYYRSAYWQPFPIYLPHFYRSRIHWGSIPWAFNF